MPRPTSSHLKIGAPRPSLTSVSSSELWRRWPGVTKKIGRGSPSWSGTSAISRRSSGSPPWTVNPPRQKWSTFSPCWTAWNGKTRLWPRSAMTCARPWTMSRKNCRRWFWSGTRSGLGRMPSARGWSAWMPSRLTRRRYGSSRRTGGRSRRGRTPCSGKPSPKCSPRSVVRRPLSGSGKSSKGRWKRFRGSGWKRRIIFMPLRRTCSACSGRS
mmetsp:Transcript_15614/g.35438  ORF Transcript_15614/g.35438 Transcript_15614/m.35438 type:complete len:213 (-) Transcript_15614:769-1407(-)